MKILIVGGGPAGATAARFLAKEFDVTLIQDKKDFNKPCGGGIKTKIFEEFELDKSIIKHQLSKIYMKHKDRNIPIYLHGDNLSIVSRKDFDSHLRKKAEEAGAKIYYGKLKKIEENTAFIKIDNLMFKFNFDILIAADGVNSTTRKLLKLPPIPYVLTYYALIDKKIDTCYFYFDKEVAGDYYAWEFPQGDKTHIGTANKKEFLKFCKRLNITPPKLKGYKIPLWKEDIIYQHNNIYFVGDAAGQVMPLSFEGIYYAMHSAKILANSIIKSLDYKTEWNNRFLKEFKLLKSFQNLMKRDFSRDFMINIQKLSFVRNLSVKLWLGD
jgi:geranylgeranyl reductase